MSGWISSDKFKQKTNYPYPEGVLQELGFIEEPLRVAGLPAGVEGFLQVPAKVGGG